MAFVCQLIEGSLDPINLFYSADDDWSLIEKGFEPNDPERRELWGGYLENVLVRQDEGKREIPLKLTGEFTTVDGLIDAVNAVEERLRHAARYRIDGWGDEVFLRWQLHGSTYGVDYPVSSGSINKADLMNACNAPMDGTGHREVKRLVNVGVSVTCGDPYWEAQETYTLENMCDNPGFWRGAAPGDSWTEVNGVDVLTSSDTGIYEVMGQSLKMVISPDAVNDTGVISDAQTVVAATNYYLEARVYSAPANDTFTVRAYDATGAAPIAASTLTFPAAAAGWVKLGVAFATPGACVSLRVEAYRLAANSSAGDKTYYLDAVYLTPGTDAPVGWSSGRNLMNCLTPTADQINVLCVTEIPGEVEAEVRYVIDLDDLTRYLRVAKRTRDNSHGFIWELNPCGAYTTAEGGLGGACAPGLTDVACLDSDKLIDATCPTGSRINVTFATIKTMVPRCYWSIATDLASYQGKFALLVIAKMEGTTDTARIQALFYDEAANYMGRINSVAVSGTSWKLKDGWEVYQYRIGTSDDDLLGAGNNLKIELWASTNGTPTDDLHIACAYLVPLDEAFCLCGSYSLPATVDAILKDMDGDRGFFAYSTATDTYYPNLGLVGGFPLLEPEIENWLYFIGTVTSDVWTHDDGYHISLSYRPRGIFLRGSNP